MNLPDARRKAAVETGGIEQIKEQVREVRIGFSIDTLSRDVRFAIRMLCKQPIFSLTVLSLLAIGIAGTTTMFSVFNSLYLRPLPLEEPERLVYLAEKAPQWNVGLGQIAYPDFDAWREGNQAFAAIAVLMVYLPMLFFELALGLWLLFKGLSPARSAQPGGA